MLERLLFKKVEMWVVLVLVILGLAGTLVFGMVVRDLSAGRDRLGPLSPVVLEVVSVHTTLSEAVRELRFPGRALLARGQKHAGQSGFDFAYAPGERPEAPYLLLNRFDGDRMQSVSELVDLDAQDVVQSWAYDVDPVWAASGFESPILNLAVDRSTSRFRGTHAIPDEDGNLVVHGMGSPLLKYDLCGDLVWQQTEMIYHHSIERDRDGNYWVPAHLQPKSVPLGDETFLDDAVVQVSPAGEVLYARSVIDILDSNGLTHLIYGNGWEQADPIHLNDIQPVLEDGEMWQVGDVFLSVRNRSLVLLYRPETGEVLWSMAGAWLHQHDVDILDERRISVFDNNARMIGTQDRRCPPWSEADPCMETRTTNHAVVVDVPTDSVERVFQIGFDANAVVTHKQGLMEVLGDDLLFVEETNMGRALAFGPDGAVDWTYVNTASDDGRVYTLNWSRIVPRATGDAIRTQLSQGACNG